MLRFIVSPFIALVLFVSVLMAILPSTRGAAAAEVIRDIVVSGVQRVEPSTIRSYLLVQVGDSFDPERIDRSLKSLFATGLFADVGIRREGDTLVVNVVENPVINRVAFEGNDRLDDETLEAETSLRPRSIYTRTKVQSDVRRILALYRRSGRFAATVEPKIIELPQNRVDVVFEIDEGAITGIERIRFVGNKEFSDSRLREVIRTRETRWWRFFTSDDVYDPDRLTFDRELLRRFYLNEGFADFRVDSAVAELTPDRQNFFITFTIDEGERYRVGTVTVDSTLRNLDPVAVREALKVEEGDWYSNDAIEKSVDAISAEVGNLGFAFVEVRPRIARDREARQINVAFEVSEGPRVFIERIDITGNVRTLDEVIRREFRFVEGDAFNTAKLRRSRQRIQDLDFFEKVDVRETPGSAPDKTVIKVDVQEKSTGSLSAGLGFSTGAGALADIGVRERNLLGRGQDLRANLIIGQRLSQVDLRFTEPYFLDREIAAGGDLFYTEVDRQDESSFDSTTLGSSLRAGYPITESFSENWRYTFKRQEIENVPNDASILIKDAEGSDLVSEISHGFLYDKRDSKIDPGDGYFTRLTTDVAGLGGSVAYLRNRLDAGVYFPLTEELVLAVLGSGGHVLGLGEDVRLLDRYFIGGDDLRGFAIDGVGPRDVGTDDAVGGKYFYTGTVQLTFPLGFPEEFKIRGRVFNDFGSAWGLDDSAPGVEDPASVRTSVGAGLTWVSPFGPLGIDLGFALVKESFDDTEILRVNFGTRF